MIRLMFAASLFAPQAVAPASAWRTPRCLGLAPGNPSLSNRFLFPRPTKPASSRVPLAAAASPPASDPERRRRSHPPVRVALVTGGTRGIGRGIAEALANSGEFGGLLLTYNADRDAADSFASELRRRHGDGLKVVLVGGDISLEGTRDAIFAALDDRFAGGEGYELGAVVHNAGQYVGITSSNAAGIEASSDSMFGGLAFGDGSLLSSTAGDDDGGPDLSVMRYYQRMYGEAYVDLCERGLARMRRAIERRQQEIRPEGDGENDGDGDPVSPFRGSLIGISAAGCNAVQRVSPGYDMPGSGKCVMEYAMRLFALRAAPLGVNCNVIIPGVVPTDAWSRLEARSGLEEGQFRERAVQNIVPMGQEVEPKEVGDVVAFLCGSHSGGRFVTGISLPVDGGTHLGKPPSRPPPPNADSH